MDLSAFPDVTDPSDFSTDNFRKLDSSLRCTICKDFYDGPVVLHCGHTFCSLVSSIATSILGVIEELCSALDRYFRTNQNVLFAE